MGRSQETFGKKGSKKQEREKEKRQGTKTCKEKKRGEKEQLR